MIEFDPKYVKNLEDRIQSLLKERDDALSRLTFRTTELQEEVSASIRARSERDAAIARAEKLDEACRAGLRAVSAAGVAQGEAEAKVDALRALLREAGEKMKPFVAMDEKLSAPDDHDRYAFDAWASDRVVFAIGKDKLIKVGDLRAIRDYQKKIEEMVG